MRRALVTGATGFVGRKVIVPLRDLGFEVHAVARHAAPGGGFIAHAVDLGERDAGRRLFDAVRPERVLHLAWYVAHGLFWEAPENATWRAITVDLARAARAAGVVRFVGVGSCAEYDPSHRPGLPRREDDRLGATTAYGREKIATFRALSDLFAGSDTAFAWARLFHLHGEGEPAGRLTPSLKAALARGDRFRVAAPAAVRDLSSTEAIGRQLAALVASDHAGAVNIASGQGVRLGDFACGMARAMGREDLVDLCGDGGAGDVLVADVSKARAAGIG